jgi:hypothetical protein
MPGPPQPAPSSRHRSVPPARPRQRDPLTPCGACCADTLSTHSRCLTTSRDRHWRPPMTSVPRPQTKVFQPKGPSDRERSMAGLTLTMDVLYPPGLNRAGVHDLPDRLSGAVGEHRGRLGSNPAPYLLPSSSQARKSRPFRARLFTPHEPCYPCITVESTNRTWPPTPPPPAARWPEVARGGAPSSRYPDRGGGAEMAAMSNPSF